ncbi:MAG: ATP synthase F0 subunit B [Deltaproteobacteria bacterium]
MISIELYTLLFQMFNFILLIFVLNLLMYKPILSIVEKRRKQLEDSQNEINSLNKSAEQKVADYEKALIDAKAQAVEQKNSLIAEGALKAKSVVDSVRGEIPGILDQFHKKVDGELKDAREVLRSHSKNISNQIAEKVLGRSLS